MQRNFDIQVRQQGRAGYLFKLEKGRADNAEEFFQEMIIKIKKFTIILDAELHIIKNGGHFNTKAGFDKFPQLLDIIKKQKEE